MRQYIRPLRKMNTLLRIIIPTDVYRSNFYTAKESCLLVSISSSPSSPFAHEMLLLGNQCYHCSSLSSTRWRWRMLALMADDCRSSSYVLNVHLHPLTPFYLQSTSFFGWDQPLPCASQWAWLHHKDPTPWSFSILFSYIDILYW